MIEDEAQARAYLATLGDKVAFERLEVLAARLREENERQNLVSRNSLDHLWLRHFADSAQLLEHVPRETKGPWLDLGTGAGFPGLVIAALRPSLEIVLVESRRKRVEWLEFMREELNLARCRIEGERLERVQGFGARVISARAFAPLDRILQLSARFSTADTLYLLPKGRSAAQEMVALPKRQRAMFHVKPSLTSREAGILVGGTRPASALDG